MRGSGSTAMRSARPKALNAVSAWWCALSPLRLSTCSVTRAWLTKPWKNSCIRSTSNSPIIARRELDAEFEPGAPGDIDHHPRQRFVQWHIGVPVAADARLVAERLGKSLAEGDTDVLDGVVRVDVKVALGDHFEVEHAVARHLIQHVVEETHAGGQLRLTRAVEVELDADLGLHGVAADLGLAHVEMTRLKRVIWGSHAAARRDLWVHPGLLPDGSCRPPQALAHGLQKSVVLLWRAHGYPQTVNEHGVRATYVFDQNPALF